MKQQLVRLMIVCVMALASGIAWAQESGSEAVLGDWTTEKEESIFHIYKEGDSYHGKITWLREPVYPAGDPDAGKKKVDRENPVEGKRNEPLLGYVLLRDFKYKDGKWTGGTIYDPTEGKTYKCNMKIVDGSLHVRGYIGVALLGRTVDWHRPTEALLKEIETTGEKL